MVLSDYLSKGSPESSMRLNMLITVLNYVPVGLALAFYIIWKCVYDKTIEWMQLSAMVTAMTAFYGMLFGMKALNKSQETKEKIAETETSKPA